MTTEVGSPNLAARWPEGPRGWRLVVAVPPSLSADYTEAGQYCRLQVADEEGYFALLNPPGPGNFEFFVKSAGGVSDRLLALSPGAPLEVSAPMGAGYRLSPALADGGPIYALATGSGLSGLRAALHVIHAAGRTVHLLVGFRTEDDVIFPSDLDAFRALGSRVQVVLSRDGRRVQQMLAAQQPDLGAAWVLACGQETMLSECRAVCEGLGLPPERFRVNY